MIAARALERLGRRLSLVVARGILKLVKDSTGLQIVQIGVLDGEVRSELERFQNYGFTSHAAPGAECVAVFPGGSRAVGYVLAVDDRGVRKKSLAEGEVAVYHRDGVTFVLLKNGEMQIKAGTKITLEAPTIDITASTALNLTAPAIALNGSTSVLVTTPLFNPQAKGDYKAHTHGGVQTGGSQTAGVT